MSALSIQPVFTIFTDIDGQPLEDGYVWIGTANLDPQTNPINVYWDAALTLPAAQPIRTLAGYPANSGTPARLYVGSDYSIRVMNKNGSVVYSAPAATERYSDAVISGVNAEDVIYDPPFIGAVQTNVEAKLAQTVSVKDFGAVGDGVADDTAAFQAAQTYCATYQSDLVVPEGAYIITQELAWPNYYQIIGEGYGSNIVLNLSAGQYAFKEAANYRYAWAVKNLRFTVKTGASTDVGALYVAKVLRGGQISNIWTYELDRPYFFGPEIYGNMRVTGLRTYRFRGSLSATTALECSSNTIFMDDIEILGDFAYGLWHKGGRVGSLTNFNIGGSTGTNQMRRAIRMENCGNMTIANGWIEQLDDSFWANGIAEAIYLKDCDTIDVRAVDVASGSLYFDGGSKNNASQIFYGQANGGLKHKNGAVFTCDSSTLKFQATGTDYSSGQPYQVDTPHDASGGVFPNPTVLEGLPNPVGRTNVGLVTIANNTADFQSGTRSMELTTATSSQGALFQATVVAGRQYTCVVRAKLVENCTSLQLVQGTNTTRNGGVLTIDSIEAAGAWRTLIIGGSSSTSTIAFRFLAQGVTGTAKMLVDSVQIYEYGNQLSPELIADPRYREGSATYDPPNLIDGAGATTTVTVTGAALGDIAVPSFSLDLQGITVTAWVSAADTVSVRFQNESGGTLDLASGTLRARVFKV